MKLPGLKAAREQALLTQARLALKADVSKATIARIERGESVGLETTRKLTETLGIDVQTLRGDAQRAAVPVRSLNDWTLDMETDEAAAPPPAAEDA